MCAFIERPQHVNTFNEGMQKGTKAISHCCVELKINPLNVSANSLILS